MKYHKKPKAPKRATRTLKQKAAYLARPLAARPDDYEAVKAKQRVRAEFLSGEAAMARNTERERIRTMIGNGVSPQLRETLLKNLDLLK